MSEQVSLSPWKPGAGFWAHSDSEMIETKQGSQPSPSPHSCFFGGDVCITAQTNLSLHAAFF